MSIVNRILQQELELNTVYRLERWTPSYGSRTPALMAEGGGTIDVYIRDSLPSSIAEMKEIQDKQEIKTQPFAVVHPYLYVEQNTATVTKLILTGIQAIKVEV